MGISLLSRMGTIKKTKETPECSAAVIVMPDIPENVLVEIKSQLREEVRNEFKQELQSLIEFKEFIMERLHLSTTRDKDGAILIPSVGASGNASGAADKE